MDTVRSAFTQSSADQSDTATQVITITERGP
jgi:hypothetical protein